MKQIIAKASSDPKVAKLFGTSRDAHAISYKILELQKSGAGHFQVKGLSLRTDRSAGPALSQGNDSKKR